MTGRRLEIGQTSQTGRMANDQLEPLITECPNCSTRFRVTESQLEVASGRVRCGACLTVFQGTEHLLWEGGVGYESTKQAAAALDDLLDELGDDGAAPAPTAPESGGLADLRSLGADPPGSDYPRTDLNPASDWEDDERQLYVGHEEELPAQSDTGTDDAAEGAEPEYDAFDPAGTADAEPPDLPVEFEAADLGVEGEDTSVPETADLAWMADEIEPAPPPDTALPPAEPTAESASAEVEPAALPDDTAAERAPPVDPLGLKPAPAAEITFAREPRRWWVGLAMLLALTALAGQIFWYQFESWGRDPTLRPVYAMLCDIFGCELPVLRDLDALRTDKLLVRSHPEFANALIVDTVIVNEAPFAQPFPALDLRFTTIDGTMVAGRLFQPEEYLAGELAGATMMPPNTPIRLALELKDPGGDAVSYFLSFR